jgi:hypothetical protein
MRGDRVIVRAFKGKPLDRRVYEVFRDKVYVCRSDLLEQCGQNDVWPVGFPCRDVFVFDADLLGRLEAAGTRLSAIWREARPYGEKQKGVTAS